MSAELFDVRSSAIPSMDSAYSHVTFSRSGRVRAKKNQRLTAYMDTTDCTEFSHNDDLGSETNKGMLRMSSNEENLLPLAEYANTLDNQELRNGDVHHRLSLPSDKPFVNNILNGTHLTPSRKRNSGCDSFDSGNLQRSSNLCNEDDLQEVRSKIAKYQLSKDDSIEASHRITSATDSKHEPQNLPALPPARKSFVSKLSMKHNSRKIQENDEKSPDFTFEDLLKSKVPLQAFREFLRSEYSEENLDFWLECEQYKLLKGAKLERAAFKIFAQYMSRTALREINIDSSIRSRTQDSLKNPDKDTFVEAQNCIYTLMRSDPFRRFITSVRYQKLSESSEGFKLNLKRVSTKKK